MTTQRTADLAREAGMHLADPAAGAWVVANETIERFADLLLDFEREAIIDLVAAYGGSVDLEAAIRARGKR